MDSVLIKLLGKLYSLSYELTKSFQFYTGPKLLYLYTYTYPRAILVIMET